MVEPSGATALAAVLAGRVGGSGPVVALLSGGNIDPLLLTKVIDHGLSAAGRYVALRLVIDDTPGNLAALTAEVARLGLNVLSVEHHRSGLDLDLDKVEIRLTLETRNAIHPARSSPTWKASATRSRTIRLPGPGAARLEGPPAGTGSRAARCGRWRPGRPRRG